MRRSFKVAPWPRSAANISSRVRSEEHTSELQSQSNLVCRLLLEKKKKELVRVLHARSLKVLQNHLREGLCLRADRCSLVQRIYEFIILIDPDDALGRESLALTCHTVLNQIFSDAALLLRCSCNDIFHFHFFYIPVWRIIKQVICITLTHYSHQRQCTRISFFFFY